MIPLTFIRYRLCYCIANFWSAQDIHFILCLCCGVDHISFLITWILFYPYTEHGSFIA
jgi:hypothetical protein